ncbi:MAG: ChaN family lipoprotein [Candidatus Riflebacteria bacterium]|nr:ChaN family lipoprotein [Candidatus Riflebacteria bacterium]
MSQAPAVSPLLPRFFLGLLLCLAWSACSVAAPLSDTEIDRLFRVDQVLKANIAQLEAETSLDKAFYTYQKEFADAVPARAKGPIDVKTIARTMAGARFVFQGDDHATPRSQANTLDLLEFMTAGRGPVTLVLEWIDEGHQKVVDAYLRGEASLTAMRAKIQFDKLWGFSWKSYSRILAAARQRGVRILLVENLKKKASLTARDGHITTVLAADQAAHPDMRYLVVYGEYHVFGRNHLSAKLAAKGFTPQVIFVSGTEAVYWQLLRQLKDPDRIGYATLAPGLFYIRNGSPLERHVAYRKSLMKLLEWSKGDLDTWVSDDEATPRPAGATFDQLHATPRR